MNSGKLLIIFMQCFVGCIVLVFPAFLLYLFIFVLYSGEDLKIQNTLVLPKAMNEKMCSSEQKQGSAGETVIKTSTGFRYILKAPLNYSAQQAWPVLVVFSPAMGGSFMEAYTGLTASTTRAGFIVAYVDSVSMNINLIPKLSEIILDINKRWCIDKEKIFLAGHSDGATIAQALNFLPEVNLEGLKLAGFISSAAGLQKNDLQNYACPSERVSAFILHNTGDTHFLNFGLGAATWWAKCQQCELVPMKAEEGCFVYEGCEKGGRVKFCEQPGNHLKWPERHKEIINFLNYKN